MTNERTVTLAEACDKLRLDYPRVRLVLAVARRTPQGWVLPAAVVEQNVPSPDEDEDEDPTW